MTSDTMLFKIACIEEYAIEHDMPPSDVVNLFERYNVYRYLDIPEVRWQMLPDAVIEIDEFIDARRP